MKYFALTGLILFLASYVVVMRDSRLLRKSIDQAREEHTTLKAKLFDFQEASRKSDPSVSTTTSTEAPEKEPEENEDEDEAEAGDSETNPK